MPPLKVYRASAGSGKTFTLAVEYIKLLVLAEGGGEYAHILGVTFTNKATAEMKDRIVTQLYAIANSLPSGEDYLAALRKALKDEPTAPQSDAEVRRRCGLALRQILHDYNRFRVQTIDAFFQSVLRALAHELGLTANLQVEISDTEVLSEAVDRIVDRIDKDAVVREWMMSLVRDQIDNNQRWDVTRQVKAFGRNIFSEEFQLRGGKLRELLSDDAALRQTCRAIAAEESQAIAALKSYGKRLDEAIAEFGVNVDDFSNGPRIFAPFLQRLREGSLSDISINATISKWAADSSTLVKKPDQRRRPDLVAAAKALGPLLAALIEELPELQRRYNSSRLALAHIKPLRLLDFIDREVALINAETSRFNLAKTPILLNRMIGHDDAPFIFEKIGTQLHHIMIDEFQDTSRLQWENFRPLLAECRSHGGRNLIVGDVKQSIYRFRGGDWRTLAYIQDTVRPEPDIVPMGINFRSEKVVVDFNTDFFLSAVATMDDASVEEEVLAGGDFSFDTAYFKLKQEASPKRMQQKPRGYVRIGLIDSSDVKRREDWEEVVLDDLCRQVARLHGLGIGYNEMTILVRNNDESLPIIQAFERHGGMPPVISDEAFLLASSTAIRLIMEALRWLDNEHDTISAYYLKSHISTPAMWEDFQNVAPQLRILPLQDLIEKLYRLFAFQTIAGQDAYLMVFLDAVADFIRSGKADIHSFVEFWDENLSKQSIPATASDGIRVMTIHKSKGLEFHTVFIPFCTWRFEKNHANILWTSPSEPPYDAFSLLPITPTQKTTTNSVFARDYAEERLNSRLDEFNVLYVALTRARANLLLWSVGKGEVDSLRSVGDLVAATIPQLPELQPEALDTSPEASPGTPAASPVSNPVAPPFSTPAAPPVPSSAPSSVPSFSTPAAPATLLGGSPAAEGSVGGGTSAVAPPPPPFVAPPLSPPVPPLSAFSVGEPCPLSKKSDEATRMKPSRQTIPVTMQSFDARLPFRQSNRSELFYAATEDDVEDLAENEALRQSHNIEFGQLLHSLLQQIATSDDIPRVLDAFEHEGVISRTAPDGTYVSIRRSDLERRLRRALSNPQVAEWYAPGVQLFTECAIVSRAADGTARTLRPDRVIISPDGSHITVVDYKTARPNEEHHEQVKTYVNLLHTMYPQASIDGFLWYILRGEVQCVW